MRKAGRKVWNSLLRRRINELTEVGLAVDSEAEVMVWEPYEQEDAVVEFLVPSEKLDELEAKVRQKAHQIWWDDGFDIIVWVHEKKPVAAKEAE